MREIAPIYTRDQVFNFDESGLLYKVVLSRTYITDNTMSAPRRKTAKEKVTVGICANASGAIHRPLLLIGKYENITKAILEFLFIPN